MDAGNPVGDLKDRADLTEVCLAGLQALDAGAQDVADLVWTYLHCDSAP
jgi:hypothetical protein